MRLKTQITTDSLFLANPIERQAKHKDVHTRVDLNSNSFKYFVRIFRNCVKSRTIISFFQVKEFMVDSANIMSDSKLYLEANELASGSVLSQMAATIADEIRNPLAGIASTISLLKEDLPDRVDDRKLKTIDSCIRRIDSFIEDLYLLTRPISPGFMLIELTEFVRQVVQQYFSAGNINYHFTSDDEKMNTNVDMILLQNALHNILDNSVYAIGRDEEIWISVEKELTENAGKMAQIIIRDSGTGMDQRVFRNLFVPFFTTKHEGRGLGLVVARNYIHFHGGTIHIESEKNKGTLVKINLPIYAGGDDAGTWKCIGS